ncbi:MAG: hypothetical protein ACFHHU_00435 [Porticoccaceae bacterium]
MPEKLTIPAEYWDRMVACCCHNAMLTHPDLDKKALTVPGRRWKNQLYVGFYAGDHGIGLHKPISHIEAYRLVPAASFKGQTTLIYQTNHTGYQVLYANKPFVCSKAVDLVKGMPGGAPVPLFEAQAFAAETLEYYDDTWTLKNGHPILKTPSFQFIVYRGLDGALRLDMFDDEPVAHAREPKQYLLI